MHILDENTTTGGYEAIADVGTVASYFNIYL